MKRSENNMQHTEKVALSGSSVQNSELASDKDLAF